MRFLRTIEEVQLRDREGTNDTRKPELTTPLAGCDDHPHGPSDVFTYVFSASFWRLAH